MKTKLNQKGNRNESNEYEWHIWSKELIEGEYYFFKKNGTPTCDCVYVYPFTQSPQTTGRIYASEILKFSHHQASLGVQML